MGLRTQKNYLLIILSLASISRQILIRILSIAVKLPYFLCAMVLLCGGMIAVPSRKSFEQRGQSHDVSAKGSLLAVNHRPAPSDGRGSAQQGVRHRRGGGEGSRHLLR